MIVEGEKEFRDRLTGLSVAYQKVFDEKNQFTKTVLKDLAKFCRAHKTTFLPDPRAHAQLEGRREVWLRIQEYLEMTIPELYDLHEVRMISRRGTKP